MGIYFQAKTELEAAFYLDPQRGKRKLFEVERKIGHLALTGKNYLLARTCFDRCIALGFEREGQKGLKKADGEEKDLIQIQKKRVQEIFSILSKGPAPSGMLDEYVTEITKMNSPHVVKELIPQVSSPHFWSRIAATTALGHIRNRVAKYKNRDAVEALIGRLKKLDVRENLSEAEALIWALGRLRDGRAKKVVDQKRWEAGQNSVLWKNTEIPFGWIPDHKTRGQKVGKKDATGWNRRGLEWAVKNKITEAHPVRGTTGVSGSRGLLHRSGLAVAKASALRH